jgi:ankyrin repeat protein
VSHKISLALPALAARAPVLAAVALALQLNAFGTAAAEDLLDAARSGDSAAALELLRDGSAADSIGNDGTTALHWAVLHDADELVGALLDAGADPGIANRYGITPLYLAAQNGSAAAIERLLQTGADPNEVGTEGETVLMTVARSGSVSAARALLEAGADVTARERWHGQTALMWAAGYGHPDLIDLLVDYGADINAASNVEEWERQVTAEPRAKWLPPGGMTPLLFAAREGCLDCIPVLVELGADVDQTTPDGISAVVSALINGHYDVAAALVRADIDPNLVDYTGRGGLYAAADFNTMPSSNRPAPYVTQNEFTALDVGRMLIERGADVNAQLVRQSPYRAKLDRGNDTVLGGGSTALMRAAKAGDLPFMQMLIDAGAQVEFRTERGGVDALLLAAGVGTTEQDTTGRFKTQVQAIAAIDLLIQSGADISSVDARGRNAAHGAAMQGYNDVLRHLASLGVDLTLEDNNGHTPLDTALGLAGGFGFAGVEGVVREDTAAVIRELTGGTGTAQASN